ncbi:MAG TPA: cold shock domain-containing protein [Stellaceae bacterium]|jgi:CspA family cold shock protein
MGKGNSYREPRRRGFDDDFSPSSFQRDRGPRPSPSFSPSPRFEAGAAGPATSATVKWFNPEKGFGFVELAGGGDAFLHIGALERAGHSAVSPGATLQVRTSQGQKGPQVAEVLEVDESTATPEAPRRAAGPRPGGGGGRPDRSTAVERSGTVRFFNEARGFGFVELGDGSKDVFVHASALRNIGVAALYEGQHVTMLVVQGNKGPEAAEVTAVG